MVAISKELGRASCLGVILGAVGVYARIKRKALLSGATEKLTGTAKQTRKDPTGCYAKGKTPACNTDGCLNDDAEFETQDADFLCNRSCKYKYDGKGAICLDMGTGATVKPTVKPTDTAKQTRKDPTGCYAKGKTPACNTDGCLNDDAEFETQDADFLCNRSCKYKYDGKGAICLGDQGGWTGSEAEQKDFFFFDDTGDEVSDTKLKFYERVYGVRPIKGDDPGALDGLDGECSNTWCSSPDSRIGGPRTGGAGSDNFNCWAGSVSEACTCIQGVAVQLGGSAIYQGKRYYHYRCCNKPNGYAGNAKFVGERCGDYTRGSSGLDEVQGASGFCC